MEKEESPVIPEAMTQSPPSISRTPHHLSNPNRKMRMRIDWLTGNEASRTHAKLTDHCTEIASHSKRDVISLRRALPGHAPRTRNRTSIQQMGFFWESYGLFLRRTGQRIISKGAMHPIYLGVATPFLLHWWFLSWAEVDIELIGFDEAGFRRFMSFIIILYSLPFHRPPSPSSALWII